MVWVARPAVLVMTMVLASVVAAADELPRAVVVPTNKAPIIDGVISEVEWAGIPVLDAPFVQVEPAFGEPSPMPTSVRFAQFGDSLFVAVEAFDPDISRLAGAGTVRDENLSNDDSIAVLLDTSGDDRTASFFRTNILGTQQDGRIADNGRTVDTRWDARWSCAAARLDDRWTVEFKIPLDVLRFAPDRGDDWGVNIIRTIPRRLETSLWSGPAETEWRVSRFGRLEGLTLPRRDAKTWQFIPYALATAEFGGEGDFEAGADLRWRPTTQLGFDLTVNPDFALVEADVEAINLSRFELQIPEKRPFFLEGNEMYSQRIRQFYSRRIGDISWGAKSTGTVGRTDISAIVTSGDLEDGDSDRAEYGVARLQHGLSGGSNIGLLAANRRVGGEDAGSVGVDTTLFFTETLGLTAQLLRVHGPEADGGLAWFVRPAYDSATTHFHIRYTNLDAGIQEDFNTVGFLRDDDRKEFDTNFTRTFWVAEGPVERVRAGVNYNRYTGQDDVLRSWELDAEIDVVLRSGWEFEIERIDEYQLFEDEFRNDRTVATVGWDGRDGREIEVFAGAGVNFDSDLSLWGMEASWPIGRLRLGYSLTRLNLDPDPEDDSTWIHVVEGRYTFNPDLFIKLFVQTNSAIDKDNIQALFVWRFKPPFGSFQVAYQTGTSDFGEESTQDDTIFTKLAWVF